MFRPLSTAALVLAAAIVVTAPSTSARADETKSDQERAIDLFQQSEKAYHVGRFEEAARLVREAYAIKPTPVLLYDLGRACDSMGDRACAIDAYERYLRDEPTAPDRGATERRIATLRHDMEALEADRRARVAVPVPVAVAVAASRRSASAAPWVVAGVGALGVAAGLVLGAIAKGKHADADADPHQRSAVATQDSAESFATGATIVIIGGALIGGTGITWGAIDLGSRTR